MENQVLLIGDFKDTPILKKILTELCFSTQVVNSMQEIQDLILQEWQFIFCENQFLQKHNLDKQKLLSLYQEFDANFFIILIDESDHVQSFPKNIYIDYLITSTSEILLRNKIKIWKHLLKQIRKEEKKNLAKSKFLSDMSHELRTPMHSILGFTNLILKKVHDSKQIEKIIHYLETIQESGNRLVSLLDEILDLSKMESGCMDYHMQEGDIYSETLDVIEKLQPLIQQQEIILTIQKVSDLPELTFDQNRIHQVLNNLIANALKYTAQKGEIRVTLDTEQQKTNDFVKISVYNQGNSIPDEELDKLFDQFFQASKATKELKSTGLGLAICREIIYAHQGTIWAKKGLIDGAQFNFILPISNSEHL
ncbi:MAG: signal transduction histidine kinase [bacterium]|jgi:signal transduction histidine kinase